MFSDELKLQTRPYQSCDRQYADTLYQIVNQLKLPKEHQLICGVFINGLRNCSEKITSDLRTKMKRTISVTIQDNLIAIYNGTINRSWRIAAKIWNVIPPLLSRKKTANERFIAQGVNLLRKEGKFSIQDNAFVEASTSLIKTTKHWSHFLDYVILIRSSGIFNDDELLLHTGGAEEFSRIDPRSLRRRLDSLIVSIEQLKSDKDTLNRLKRTFIEDFLNLLALDPNPESLNNFHQRVAKVWLDISFDSRGGDPEFRKAIGEEGLKQDPTRKFVLKAALEELRYRMVKEISKQLQGSHVSRAAEIYQNLPGRDRRAIAFLTHQSLKEKDPSASSIQLTANSIELFERFVRGEIRNEGDREVLSNAFYKYSTEGQIALRFDMIYRCNELNKGFFFKIKNSQGTTRGYILGSCHILPKDTLKLRRIVFRSLYKSKQFVPEYSMLEETRVSLHKLKQGFRKLPIHLGYLDEELFFSAIQQGKEIVNGETKELREALGPIRKSSSGKSYFKEGLVRLDKAAHIAKMDPLYKNGDLKELAEFQKNEDDDILPEKRQEYESITLHNRNKAMGETIDRILKENRTNLPFCCFGAGHLVDTEHAVGLLTQLRDKGWTVRQV